VGHPQPWVQLEIVDDDGRPVPDGEAGEIWVTSRDVAFGYWDEPALTAERFSGNTDGTRTVRTGDRARIRPDGMLEILGRNDRRVKVNGQLVDLSVVEHEVELLPDVREAVVSSVPTDDGGHRVVAHVVLDRPTTVGALRRGLAGRLPPYALPRAFFRVDDVPHTINGKVDRLWLRESAIGALPLETDYVSPRTEREAAVAQLFREVLAVERVGVHDDFFELGGDSLAVVELLGGISEEFGVEISGSEMLRHATVEAVATRIEGVRARPERVVVQVHEGAGRPLFCVPGAAGTPVQLRPFGRRLPDTSTYAFGYRGLEHRALPDQTIAAIARRNTAAMRAVDPEGPYRILGYSFGGSVALAMAQQLVDQGATVELLALLEPSLTMGDQSLAERGRAYAGRVQQRSLDAHPGQGLDAQASRVWRVLRAGGRRVEHHVRVTSAGLVERHGLAQHDVFLELHKRMLRLHRPKPYLGRTVVLASPRYFELGAPELDRVLPPVSRGGQRHEIPVAGEHLDLVREPAVAEVARALRPLLDGQT
jgi:thioesterase domain-containing protein/acyl carrier protein